MTSFWPWLAIGALLIGSAAVFISRFGARNPEADASEADIDAALEGALIRELNDFHFAGGRK